ncbi:SLBB domain-containing protein [Jiulongibacter sediminis]|uniref:polysaccharide biosynthesis/export family protein n=1 Tax=Jiulongibacter sediminis TaxID=1605367 RepID=UPI0026EFD446|nr:SLBB domain-containing protein [Jiulongibacter sediminis]
MMQSRFLFVLFIMLSLTALAQSPVDIENVTDAQVEQFLKEAEERGLTEQEIEAAARLNGYSAQDIAMIRERIERLKSGENTLNKETVSDGKREQLGEVAKRIDLQVDDSTEVGKKTEVYGRSIFRNQNLTFEPNLRLPTPPNYTLGPDDELMIDITGYAFQHYDVKVSPEGTIQLESLSPFQVSGLTIEQAKAKIKDRLKLLFGGLRNNSLGLDVTLGDVRSIQVNILGEIEKPGTYTLSAFSTPLNALYLSGGPTVNGSFRTIKVLRQNQLVQEVDLYQLLNSGQYTNLLLKDGDVIFVPVAERKVELEGEVKRAMIYELKAEESLADAILYAGNFSEQAYTNSVKITRYTGKEKKLVTLGEEQFDDFLLKNGDHIFIGAVLDRVENQVEVLGAVFRPGTYALDEELKTVGDLIKIAEGLKEDAFKTRVILRRENDHLDTEIITLNLMNSTDWEIPLKREDILIIKSYSELREVRSVEIKGAIVEPGEYEFQENMSVNDLIFMAGGLADGAEKGNIEIARRVKEGDLFSKNVQILPFDTNDDLISMELTLRPFDQVYVREIANYEKQQIVKIVGQVKYPGEYVIQNRGETIADLVTRAGGLLKGAYVEGAKFYKEGKLLALDLKNVLSSANKIGNLVLQEGDSLFIPKKMDYVFVKGQVLNPTIVAYDPAFEFNDYIAQAGGYTDSAYVRKAYVRYANGLTDRTRSFLGIKDRPSAARGMEIVVPTRVKYRWTPAERIAVSSAMVSIATIMVTIVRLF